MVVQRLSSLTVQKSLLDRLSDILSIPVLDAVPDSQVMPYAVIGNDTTTVWNHKSAGGEEYTIVLHVWSEYAGNKEIAEIKDVISQSLTTTFLDLSVDNFKVIETTLELSEIIRDPDGRTRQGILRFRLLISDIS